MDFAIGHFVLTAVGIMYINRPKISRSRNNGSNIRVETVVEYADGEKELLWIEVPSQKEEFISSSGNPWLVMLLPVAITLQESIRTELTVDRKLAENLYSLQRIWQDWYGHLTPIELNCPIENLYGARKYLRKTASFFSGGVDSFYTLVSRTGSEKNGELDALITVWGFDIPLTKPEEFEIVAQSLFDVANNFGVSPLSVSTNLRETRFRRASWGGLAHGCALAGIGLLFEDEYREVLIGSTHTIPDFQPWGSHVLTDPLCSTSRTSIVHDGATCTRVEKTETLSRSEFALKHLRVCWKEQAAGNCGNCGKCLRTMATLDLLGKLKVADSFAHAHFSMEKLACVYLANENDISFFHEIVEASKIRNDFVSITALQKAIDRSRGIEKYINICDFLETTPLLWRYQKKLRQFLLKDFIS